MSTRCSIYYDGPVHVWYEMMDGGYYVQLRAHGTHHRVWKWVAMSFARVMHLTGRSERHDAEMERIYEANARQRIAEGNPTSWDLERYGDK